MQPDHLPCTTHTLGCAPTRTAPSQAPRPCAGRWPEWRRWWRRELQHGLWVLILLGALGPRAQASTLPGKPSIMVMPFDLFDGSADQRPAILAAQQRALLALPGEVNRALRAGRRWRVIDNSRVRPGLLALAGDYAHPTLCGLCMLKLGEQAGVDYVVVGQLRKVSDLIIYLQADIDDVRTHQVVDHLLLEVKADNASMLGRAARSLARQIDGSKAFATP